MLAGKSVKLYPSLPLNHFTQRGSADRLANSFIRKEFSSELTDISGDDQTLIAVLERVQEQSRRLLAREKLLIRKQKRLFNSLVIIDQEKRFIKPDEWPKVYASVDNICPGFYDNLMHKYPWLTERDLEVCSLIKLGYPTREIAVYTAVSPAAITKRKQRIMSKIIEEASVDHLCAKYISLDVIVGGL